MNSTQRVRNFKRKPGAIENQGRFHMERSRFLSIFVAVSGKMKINTSSRDPFFRFYVVKKHQSTTFLLNKVLEFNGEMIGLVELSEMKNPRKCWKSDVTLDARGKSSNEICMKLMNPEGPIHQSS